MFPEKCSFELNDRPKSGTYRLSAGNPEKSMHIEKNWVSLENQAFSFDYTIIADGERNSLSFDDNTVEGIVQFEDSMSFQIMLIHGNGMTVNIRHEILPNGYMKVTEKRTDPDGNEQTDCLIYHKQMSVLPYSSSVSGAVIKPTEEGLIKHKALTAMEEQTNMQLNQIRQQIELLALQAQEIQKRKELSILIYGAKLSFTPVIGQTYHLYEKKDNSHFLSMVSPKEWGASGPFKRCVAAVKLLADHTWTEII